MEIWTVWCDKDVDNLKEISCFKTKDEAEKFCKEYKLSSEDYFISEDDFEDE